MGALDTVALAASKTKTGEREYLWTTTGTGDDEDCIKEDEADGNSSLWSVCFWHQARIAYRFLIPRRAKVTGFAVNRDEGDSLGCIVEDMWAVRTGPRRAKVIFIHGPGTSPGNRYGCNIHFVTLQYRVPI
jgi:hypothetical protein